MTNSRNIKEHFLSTFSSKNKYKNLIATTLLIYSLLSLKSFKTYSMIRTENFNFFLQRRFYQRLFDSEVKDQGSIFITECIYVKIGFSNSAIIFVKCITAN